MENLVLCPLLVLFASFSICDKWLLNQFQSMIEIPSMQLYILLLVGLANIREQVSKWNTEAVSNESLPQLNNVY